MLKRILALLLVTLVASQDAEDVTSNAMTSQTDEGVELTTTVQSPEEEEYPQYDESGPAFCETRGNLSKFFIDNIILESVNKNIRAPLMAGNITNGKTEKRYPKAEFMMEVQWSCDLEEKAIEILGSQCTEKKPEVPKNCTGLFYKRDDPVRMSDMATAFYLWREQSSDFTLHPVYFDKKRKVVKFPRARQLREFLNLARAKTTHIGCAQLSCEDGDLKKYRALCLTNKPALKPSETVYRMGKGVCKKGRKCRSGGVCTEDGLCRKESKMEN